MARKGADGGASHGWSGRYELVGIGRRTVRSAPDSDSVGAGEVAGEG